MENMAGSFCEKLSLRSFHAVKLNFTFTLHCRSYWSLFLHWPPKCN